MTSINLTRHDAHLGGDLRLRHALLLTECMYMEYANYSGLNNNSDTLAR